MSKLQEEAHYRVLRILQENPDLTQRELANQLGISLGSLNYCLKGLMAKGSIKMHNFRDAKNKFGYIYMLTPHGIAERAALTRSFLTRKMQEYELLKNEIELLKNDDAKLHSNES